MAYGKGKGVGTSSAERLATKAGDLSGLVGYVKLIYKGMDRHSGTDWAELDLVHSLSTGVDSTQQMNALIAGVFGGSRPSYHESVNAASYNGSADRRFGPARWKYTYKALRERVQAAGLKSWHALDVFVEREDEWARRFGLR